MELIKQIDTSIVYQAFEHTWWLHNDDAPNSWNRASMIMSNKKWKKWFNENFEPFQTTYHTKDKKNPFAPKYIRAYYKIDGVPCKQIMVTAKQGIETKTDISIDFDMYFHVSHDKTAAKIAAEISKMIIF
jgi:hypothetical protein